MQTFVIIKNEKTFSLNDHDYYKWTVFLRSSSYQLLRQIKKAA
ncbi:hypothetical protein [Staphylococcus borealis]